MAVSPQDRANIWSGVNLASMMAELAQALDGRPSLEQTLQAIVDTAVRIVPGADFASITLNTKGSLSTPAYSHPACLPPDVAQYETGEGPCVEATWDDEVVVIPSVETETRWPEWLKRVRCDDEMASIMAIKLEVPGPAGGAINLYARKPWAFSTASEAIGLVFASHASLAMARAEREEQLMEAMEGRDVIGQAKGRLMERFDIPADSAFEVLRRLSRDSNTKLREVAVGVANGTRDVQET